MKKRSIQTKLVNSCGSSGKKQKGVEYVVCPVCEAKVNSSFIHLHIDACLVKSSARGKDSGGNEESKQHDDDNVTQTDESVSSGMRVEEISSVPGVWMIHNFITAEEEEKLVKNLDDDSTPWHFSAFNGNCYSKSFGVKTQFGSPAGREERCVRRNNPDLGEMDIPKYLEVYPERLRQIARIETSSAENIPLNPGPNGNSVTFKRLRRTIPPEVASFVPNECNANSYESRSKHFLRPHFDDRILSGPFLMNLSMNCDARMTYHLSRKNGDRADDEISVMLPRRTLQLVTGPARWKYRHSIKAEDVLGERRVSITWRRSESKVSGMRHQAVSLQDERVRASKKL